MSLAKPPPSDPFDLALVDRPIRRAAPVLPIPAGDGVVICTVARPAGDAGVQNHTRTLQSALARLGVHCQVVDSFAGSPKWLPVFAARKAIAPFNPSASTNWHRRWHAAALRENLIHRLKEKRPRAIIAQCPPSAQAAMEACSAMRMHVPIALVVHFIHSQASEYRAQGQLASHRAFAAMLEFEKRVIRKVDQVIYVSAWAKRMIEVERGIVPRASTVIWDGIADSGCIAGCAIDAGSPNDNDSSNRLRKTLDLTAEDKILINVGVFEGRNNPIGLLELFANIAGRELSAKLVLIGDGPQRRHVEQRIAARRLGDRVRLLGRRSDVPALLPLADLYVHFATQENCSAVLMEAARAGIPAVAAAGGGAAEILAALEQPAPLSANPAAAANAILDLLGDEPRRRQAAAAARRNFQQKFTAADMAEKYLTLLGAGRPR